MNMKASAQNHTGTANPPVAREYDIGGVKYIVTATARPGANENAAAKVRRLIRNELNDLSEK